MMTENPVGVLDSGVGGISILKALVEFMPYENFMYFGDSMLPTERRRERRSGN